MGDILSQLEYWFAQRPLWIQDATRRIIQNNTLDTNDFDELTALCKKEFGIFNVQSPQKIPQGIPTGALSINESSVTFRLEQIDNVNGVNALSPRKPLQLGDGSINIVFGGTGSGKSSYVRLLKHACGAKRIGKLYGNVFEHDSQNQECTFKVSIDGEVHSLHWKSCDGILEKISNVQIYDEDCAYVYLTEDNEVIYEPWILSLLTELTNVCREINKRIKEEIENSITNLPPLPDQYKDTHIGHWYSQLSHKTRQREINARCLWNQNLEISFHDLNERLSSPDPVKQANQLRVKRNNLETLHDKLKAILDKLSDEKCTEYLNAKQEAFDKRKAADEDAKKVFENASLDGVGSKSWMLLWEKAREYSEYKAYPDITFPNITEGSRCVLCHQLLNQEAKERFRSFEDFVKGELQKQAKKAEEKFAKIKDDIEDIFSTEQLKLYIDSAGITEEKERENISTFHDLICKRKTSLFTAQSLSECSNLPNDSILKKLKNFSKDLNDKADKYDKAAQKENRDLLNKRTKELAAKKYVSELKKNIEAEVERLKKIDLLKSAQRSTNSKPISDKKSAIADELISPAFIKRFKDELDKLDASHINVELAKTKTEYGRVYHRIRLCGCTKDVCTTEILSDGEFRIVSLAAFLADVEGHPNSTPFVFDDPITSVDQDFEEATANRLVELSFSRQVIVFTHRISFLSLLEESSYKQSMKSHVVCVRREGRKVGEPGETLVKEKRPINALKNIKDNRLSQATKALRNSGWAVYEPIAGSICRDIRILIERIIEINFLANIIQRFRREVQTKNKIHKLANIDENDCHIIDHFMSKYSKYEHSQPMESPVPIPEPDEIESDIQQILDWVTKFTNNK